MALGTYTSKTPSMAKIKAQRSSSTEPPGFQWSDSRLKMVAIRWSPNLTSDESMQSLALFRGARRTNQSKRLARIHIRGQTL